MAPQMDTPEPDATAGLCHYSDPEEWFNYRTADHAKLICGNCPVRRACAAAALDLEVTDGVWGGVKLPGVAAPLAQLEAARRQLRLVVAAMERQPEAHRQRCLAIREAVHHYSFPSRRAARRSLAVVEPASA